MSKLKLIFLILVFLTISVIAPADVKAATDTTGIAAFPVIIIAGWTYASPITVSGTGIIQSIGVDWASTQSANVVVALYTDAGSVPGSLLTSSASTAAITSAGFQDISSLSPSISVSPGRYWLAVEVSSTEQIFSSSAPSALSLYQKAFGTFDSTWYSAATSESYNFNMRITYQPGPDFSVTPNPSSQSIGAGSTATSTLTLSSQGGYSGSVAVTVSSGCPTSAICSISASPVSIPNPGSVQTTLSVTTTLSTPSVTNASVVVIATDGTHTHTVTFTVTVNAPQQFNFNVKTGATQIVVTVTWTGSGAASVSVGNSTFMDSGAQTYDRTSIAVVSGQQSTTSNIHRATFTAPSTFNGSGSNQVWALYVSGPSSFTVTVEVT